MAARLQPGEKWCDACEGTGHHWRHDPQPDDPYLMTETRDPCRVCDGTGKAKVCAACGCDEVGSRNILTCECPAPREAA